MRVRTREIIAKVLLLTISLAISLVFAEVLIRWVVPQELTPLAAWDSTGLTIYDPELGHALRPNFEGPWVGNVVVKVNSIGLRDREYPAKRKNEIRILSLGDSYAFGYGVELSESYPKVLEKMLSARFPQCDFSVVNGAVSGYSTYQEILVLQKLYGLLHPDFVLATFVGSNDVTENAVIVEQLQQKVQTPVGFLGHHSHLVRLVLRTIYPITNRASNWWGPNISHTIELLRELEKQLRTKNLPYTFLVIPARHQIRPEVNLASEWVVRLGLYDFIIRHNTAIIRHFEIDRIPYIDLLPLLREHDKLERVSLEDSHTNPVGHRVIAEAVNKWIEPKIAELARKKQCLSQ